MRAALPAFISLSQVLLIGHEFLPGSHLSAHSANSPRSLTACRWAFPNAVANPLLPHESQCYSSGLVVDDCCQAATCKDKHQEAHIAEAL